MARVLVDTSAVYALVDRSDAQHAKARKRLRGLKKMRAEPVLTNFIVAECHALLLARVGHATARAWLATNIWPIERVSVEDEQQARSIIGEYVDKSFSYTDATTFALMKRLHMECAFAFDKHFAQYGFAVVF